MAIRGGYKIIDFKDLELTPYEGLKIEGIYDSIEASYHKPLMLSGINIGGTTYMDRYCSPYLLGTAFVFDLSYNTTTIKIKVEDTDVVTAEVEVQN